ncbi:MAG: hypothetical protein J3K34DRAFT_516747 [Monoraphidium minutum]|nr:MAG: hypothetical protein J3K34DRAFT_516747 [Monoraphidium minutum]
MINATQCRWNAQLRTCDLSGAYLLATFGGAASPVPPHNSYARGLLRSEATELACNQITALAACQNNTRCAFTSYLYACAPNDDASAMNQDACGARDGHCTWAANQCSSNAMGLVSDVFGVNIADEDDADEPFFVAATQCVAAGTAVACAAAGRGASVNSSLIAAAAAWVVIPEAANETSSDGGEWTKESGSYTEGVTTPSIRVRVPRSGAARGAGLSGPASIILPGLLMAAALLL